MGSLMLSAAVTAIILALLAGVGLAYALAGVMGFRSSIPDLARRVKQREQDMHDTERRLVPQRAPRRDNG